MNYINARFNIVLIESIIVICYIFLIYVIFYYSIRNRIESFLALDS